MNVYTCIIIDDEIQSINLMSIFVKRMDQLLCLETFNSSIKASEFLKNNKVDIIFTDINMPEQLGTDFAKTITQTSKIIFTTAHINYALEAFEVEAVDYLVKPITFNRLQKAVEKAIKQLTTYIEPQPEEDYIFLKKNKTLCRIYLKDILYIKSNDDYIIYTTREGGYIIKKSLKNALIELDNSDFIQVHRSFLININCIDKINSSTVIIKNTEIPLGRVYKKKLKNKLKN